MSKSEANLVQVYRAKNDMEAQVIKSKLESYGIPCILKTHGAPSVFPFTVDGMAEVRVMVPAEMAAEAKELVTGENTMPDTS